MEGRDPSDDDLLHMGRALELAREAAGAGETGVGSVVVRAGSVLGEGRERTRELLDPSAHAEVEALRAACRSAGSIDLTGATLYTTVEPCLLCGYALRASRVQRVVYGVPADEVGSVAGRHPILVDTGFERWRDPPVVLGGVLHEAARKILAGRDTA